MPVACCVGKAALFALVLRQMEMRVKTRVGTKLRIINEFTDLYVAQQRDLKKKKYASYRV